MRLAHLSDLHLNGSADRRLRFLRTLDLAALSGADRLVLTGDLTARGRVEELHEVGKTLETSGWTPATTHVVFGNHDGPGAASLARNTALGPYTGNADYYSPGLALLLVDTVWGETAPLFLAAGKVRPEDVLRMELAARSDRNRAVIAAMHHGPQGHPLEWFEGLVGKNRLLGALRRNPNLHVLSGHDHRAIDRGKVRVAPSVAHHQEPLRTYDVAGPFLLNDRKSRDEGSWWHGLLL